MPTVSIDKAKASPEQQSQLAAVQPPRRKLLKTATCWTLGAFTVLNACLWLNSNDSLNKKVKGSASDSIADLWSGAGSIDIAVNDWKALKQTPSVVLLGSSLMMYPFWSMDVEADKSLPDIFHYHGSKTLEKELAKDGLKDQHVFSFAIFGQMVSDAYIYVNDFLDGAKKPKVLVYGLAPRDFSDADLPAPMATFSFKRLVGLDNFGRYASSYLPGWQDKADFVATHSVYLYGKRWRLQHEVGKALEKAYGSLGVNKEDQAVAQKQAEQPANNGFMMDGSVEARWRNSTKEYRRRYHDIENRDLSLQENFLKKLLATCEQRNIKVVLVNMPLSETNRSLMEPTFYQKFRSTIKTIADRPNVKLVDLGESKAFVPDDYWDTAHLNHFGGHKLLSAVTPVVADMLKQDEHK